MALFTSGERRGTILLLGLMAVMVIVVAMCNGVWRGASPEQSSSDTILRQQRNSVVQPVAVDSVSVAKPKKMPSGSKRKKPLAPQGRQRDYLSEPV